MEGIETNETHSTTIIHIDIDCFYAQVEEILNPALRTKPIGIQQKNCIVTSNYKAREFGIQKLMLLNDAKKLCPNLILVNGEDLTKYKEMSSKIFNVIKNFSINVEKLGFDENYIDVTSLTNKRLEDTENTSNLNFEGFTIPDKESFSLCSCGCDKRLLIGSHIAKEIRDQLFNELGITSCAGIGHNKLLAKLAGSMNKPNKQTTLAPACASIFMSSLGSVRNITGIGQKTEQQLKELGIETIQELQDCDEIKLEKKFGHSVSARLKDSCFGRDSSPVIPSGKPKTIGLEDSCKVISLKTDVEDKFRTLLVRLITQISKDNRIPVAIKIILRKFDSDKKTSHRETKQCNLSPSLFRPWHNDKIKLIDGGQEKILKIIMRLFEKSIDMNKPFNITLLGLAFSKFQERQTGTCSIANFLMKKSDVEVQSVTNICNNSFNELNKTINYPMDEDSIYDTAGDGGLSEPEVEPSPKKSKFGLLIAKRRCFSSSNPLDLSSPSKLRVAELRLNSRDSDRDSPLQIQSTNDLTSNCSSNNNVFSKCPPSVDQSVFNELPIEVQNELLASWRKPQNSSSTIIGQKSATTTGNTLHRYFLKN